MQTLKTMTNLAHIHALLPKSKLHNIELSEAMDLEITKVSSDSRTLKAGELFVALQGERFDAHQFLTTVYAQGASAALISEASVCPSNLPAVYVRDTRKSLGELACAWRKQFTIPLVLVTGSNGKTTVKEMIASIFKEAVGQSHALITEGNLNNEIGLPLTLLKLRPDHRIAVIELGMNHPGETAELAAIALPTISLINNAQREHQEFMESINAVALEHAAALRALPHDGVGVFPANTAHSALWKKSCASQKYIEFAWLANESEGKAHSSTGVQGFALSHERIQIQAGGSEIQVQLNTLGEHNWRNALAACATALAAGISLPVIKAGLEKFQPVVGRMQRIALSDGVELINDSYNANPDSVVAAVKALARCAGERYLVLGDMGEVGTQGPAFHQELGSYAAQQGIEHLMTLGELSKETQIAYQLNKANGDSQHYQEIESLNAQLLSNLKKLAVTSTQGVTVLVKGSRFMRMERVVEALVKGIKTCS